MNPYCLTPQGLDSRGVQLDFHFLLQQARGLSYVESKKFKRNYSITRTACLAGQFHSNLPNDTYFTIE